MASPLVWGTDLWKTCHRFSLAYPDKPSPKQKQAARAYFSSLSSLLPCAGCRRHYEAYFKQHFSNASIESRDALVKWVYDLHEEVNRRLGKPVGAVKIEDLHRLYNTFPRRYISTDGKQLLRTPRYSTVGNDIGFEDKVGDAANVEEKKEIDSERPSTPVQNETARESSATTLSHALKNQMEAAEHASATDVLADIDSGSGMSTTTMWIILGVIGAIALLLIIAIIVCIVIIMQRSSRTKESQFYVSSIESNYDIDAGDNFSSSLAEASR
jgi:hypothetical protein